MILHLPNKFRYLISFSIVMVIVAIIFIRSNDKAKKEYPHITGKIIYLDTVMGDLPYRDMGKFRYVTIENYQYPFEIYADEQGKLIDSLKKGDIATVYFYENSFTQRDKINRFAQYIEKNDKLYFKRTDFSKNLGYAMILLLLLAMIFFFILYKRGVIPY